MPSRNVLSLILLSLLCCLSTYSFSQSYKKLTFSFSSPGKRIQNKFTDVNTWNYHSFWLDNKAVYPSDFFLKNYPFIKYVQLMSTTGGSVDRDLFSNPLDKNSKNDYNAKSLVVACKNIVKQGLKPYIVTGNVPLKFSKKPAIGSFSVNVSPPENYNDYYNYIYHIADTLVKCFGIQEVKKWKWGVLTEYENGDWYNDNNDSVSTKLNYFKLYDYTVAALQQAIKKQNLLVGAHSMTTIPGLWDEKAFIEHCAKGINYKTKKRGTQINFLTTSYYDPKPGQYSFRSLTDCVDLLRNSALKNGLRNLKYGVDEGKILNGPDGKVLLSRSIGYSYQAAVNARLFKTMIEKDISWFSTWALGPEEIWDDLPSMESNFSNLAYKMTNDSYVKANKEKNADTKNALEGIGGFNKATHTAHIIIYNVNENLTSGDEILSKISLNNVKVQRGSNVIIKKYVIDNENANWWTKWVNDQKENGITIDHYKDSVSVYSLEVPWILKNQKSLRIWKEKRAEYKGLAKLNYTQSLLSVKQNKIEISTRLKANSVVLYEITNITNAVQ
nr:hypothetical protein [uncultured Mucilaginibacter sp.]